jgi:peptidase E
MTHRWIVAMGGGGFSTEGEPSLAPSPLDTFVLGLGRERATRCGRDDVRICFVGTASGDAPEYLARFHVAFDDRATAVHLGLFERTVDDVDAFLLDQDVVYVGGGNTASMLAVWRAHRVDRALRRAHEAGVILAGLSAGSICWFESGTTDSYGPNLGVVDGGLGLIAGSHTPHYDVEPQRRPTYHRLVGTGTLPPGYAVDDQAALVFDGPTLVEVIAARPGAAAYRVEPVGDGADVIETVLDARPLW